MSAVGTYRAMDYNLKTYGFWPTDLIAIGLSFVAIHAIGDSLLADFLIIGPAGWLAYKGRKRQAFYLRSLSLFVTTPRQLAVALNREACR